MILMRVTGKKSIWQWLNHYIKDYCRYFKREDKKRFIVKTLLETSYGGRAISFIENWP